MTYDRQIQRSQQEARLVEDESGVTKGNALSALRHHRNTGFVCAGCRGGRSRSAVQYEAGNIGDPFLFRTHEQGNSACEFGANFLQRVLYWHLGGSSFTA
jgi:hypothetical protein